jgi:SAM-dependent methyltransferase
MIKSIKGYLRKKVWAVVLLNIAQNVRNALLAWTRRTIAFSIDCSTKDPHELARYSQHMVHEYRRAAGSDWNITDQRIIEIGPGPFNTVALLLYAAGARQVISYDKYAYEVDTTFERKLYQALGSLLTESERDRLHTIIDPETGLLRSSQEAVIRISGGDFRDLLSLYRGKADWIISRSVLEYMDDLSAVMKTCVALLGPDGKMAHKVDLRDDGMFSLAGLEPRTFYRIPAPIYRLMISHTYRPRRWRPVDFIQLGHKHFQTTRLWTTQTYEDMRDRPEWIRHDVKSPVSSQALNDTAGCFIVYHHSLSTVA